MEKVRVGVIGLGTVGSGVVVLLERNKQLIYEKTGIDIELVRICDRNVNKSRPFDIRNYNFTTDYREVVSDNNIDVIIELIGGTEVAYNVIELALKSKKHVITANKALLAEKGKRLFHLAKENEVCLRYEASVAGAIPIVEAMLHSLATNRIKKIIGILNGTSNYVLTRMKKDKLDFKDAVIEAQKRGYAEADPTLDIDGTDAAHKITLLSSIAFNRYVDYYKVYKSGIDYISLDDIIFADEMGYEVKLLAIAKDDEDEGYDVRVHLGMIPKSHPLSSVLYEYNAVFVEGDMVGNMLFYGKGAGSYPTASAVVSDILWIAKSCRERYNYLLEEAKQKDILEVETEYYIRFMTIDKPGVLSKIAGVLGEYNISIAQVVQRATGKSVVPVVMITHKAKEKDLQNAITEIEKMKNIIKQKTMIIRIEE
jgi:homoserine dehydrogenase